MARSPLTLDAIVCAACGGKVREDRTRCLRCGAPLVAAPAAGPRSSPALTRLLAVAGIALTAALVGAAIRPARAVVPPPSAGAAGPAAAAVVPPARDEAAPVARPVPVPATSRDAMAVGLVAYGSGDVPAAIAQFQRAVELNPDDADALNSLGQTLVRANRAAEAVPQFDRAIALVPDSWAYRFNRARALSVMERWSDAVAGYRDAQRLFPDDYATQFNLARALQKNGDLPAALDAFERAIAMAPGQPDFHLAHAAALEAAERPRDAAAAYRRYLDLAGPSPEADKVKGRIALLERPAAGAGVQP